MGCVTSSNYSGVQGVLIAFDITDMSSFENVTMWLKYALPPPLLLRSSPARILPLADLSLPLFFNRSRFFSAAAFTFFSALPF